MSVTCMKGVIWRKFGMPDSSRKIGPFVGGSNLWKILCMAGSLIPCGSKPTCQPAGTESQKC